MSLRVAIVGCGKIADGHVGEIRRVPGATIVGVCDREPLMAEQLAMRMGIERWTDDLGRLLEWKPDVVHVTTPPQAHLDIARRVMDAGAHVYVEKPLAMNLAETRALLDHARRTGRRVTVGHSFAFDPVALDMRRRIARGDIGEVVHVESWFGYNLSGPFGAAILADPAHWVHGLPGGLFHNNIDHMLNKITEFVEDDRPEVVARAFTRRLERFGDARDRMADELRVTVRGRRVTGYGTFSSSVRPVAHFARVYGTEGILHVDYALRTVTAEPGPTLPSAIGRLLPPWGRARVWAGWGVRNGWRFARARFHFFAGMHELIRRFYAAVRGEGDVPVPYRDIERIAWIMETIFRQVGQASADGEDAG